MPTVAPIERESWVAEVATPITSRLTAGMRAFAISVDVTSGVSGFLRPGDRVDVYWSGTVEEGGRSPRGVTQLIDSGVKIVAVDQTPLQLDSVKDVVGAIRRLVVRGARLIG